MRITDNVHLEKTKAGYFRLVEKGMSVPKMEGKSPREIDINVREFSTVYQALQAIIEYDYDLEEDMITRLEYIVKSIDEAKAEIKKQFRVEVMTAVGR